MSSNQPPCMSSQFRSVLQFKDYEPHLRKWDYYNVIFTWLSCCFLHHILWNVQIYAKQNSRESEYVKCVSAAWSFDLCAAAFWVQNQQKSQAVDAVSHLSSDSTTPCSLLPEATSEHQCYCEISLCVVRDVKGVRMNCCMEAQKSGCAALRQLVHEVNHWNSVTNSEMSILNVLSQTGSKTRPILISGVWHF